MKSYHRIIGLTDRFLILSGKFFSETTPLCKGAEQMLGNNLDPVPFRPKWVSAICIIGVVFASFSLLAIPMTHMMSDMSIPQDMKETMSEEEIIEFQKMVEESKKETQLILDPLYAALSIISSIITLVYCAYQWKMRILAWHVLVSFDTPVTFVTAAYQVIVNSELIVESCFAILLQAALIYLIYNLKEQGQLN